MATGRPFGKILIKYNSNDSEENNEEEKELLIFSLLSKKLILKMIKMLLTLDDRMYENKMRQILLWLTLKKNKKGS